MMTLAGFAISKTEGSISSPDALLKQRYPRLNYNFATVEASSDILKVGYEFSATYFDSDAESAKKVGELKLSGNVELKDSKDSVASIAKKWKDDKTLPPEVAEIVLDNLNFRCGAAATLMAYSLGLIPPLVISKTKIEEKK
jgi:hypothetical protein